MRALSTVQTQLHFLNVVILHTDGFANIHLLNVCVCSPNHDHDSSALPVFALPYRNNLKMQQMFKFTSLNFTNQSCTTNNELLSVEKEEDL